MVERCDFSSDEEYQQAYSDEMQRYRDETQEEAMKKEAGYIESLEEKIKQQNTLPTRALKEIKRCELVCGEALIDIGKARNERDSLYLQGALCFIEAVKEALAELTTLSGVTPDDGE